MKVSLIFLGILIFTVPCSATNYYFSANSGDDSRTKNSINLPWKSINKLNSIFSELHPGDSVLFKRGDTFFGTINISASGSAGKPIVIADYGKGPKPVITSLKTITDWQPTANAAIYVSKMNLTSPLQLVLVNNLPQGMGRYPNAGYLYFESHNGKNSITDDDMNTTVNWAGAELVLRKNHWVLDRLPITSIEGKTINYSNGKGEPKDGFGYFYQNSLAALDAEGEWFYDSAASSLYMYFHNKKTSAKIKIAALDNLVSSRAISYITIAGIVLKGSNRNAVNVVDGSHISIKNCEVYNAGDNGIRVVRHKNFLIENSVIRDCYNDGINALYSSRPSIKNNTIKNTYMIAGMGGSSDLKGAGIRNGYKGIVEFNTIINSGYIGIQLGGDSEIIKNNIIDSFCLVKDDGGGIYAVKGKQNIYYAGKIIGNIISNGIGAGEGTPQKMALSAEGIYMDDNVSGIQISDNTISGTNWGIYLHNAYNIIITGNTSYNNLVQFYAKHDNNHPISDIIFTGNNLITQKNNQTVMSLISSEDDIKNFGRIDSNFYVENSNKKGIYIQYKTSGILVKDRPQGKEMKEKYGYDVNSSNNQINLNQTPKGDYNFKIFTNTEGKSKSISLSGPYIDKKKISHQKSITVSPYSSIVFFQK